MLKSRKICFPWWRIYYPDVNWEPPVTSDFPFAILIMIIIVWKYILISCREINLSGLLNLLDATINAFCYSLNCESNIFKIGSSFNSKSVLFISYTCIGCIV